MYTIIYWKDSRPSETVASDSVSPSFRTIIFYDRDGEPIKQIRSDEVLKLEIFPVEDVV